MTNLRQNTRPSFDGSDNMAGRPGNRAYGSLCMLMPDGEFELQMSLDDVDYVATLWKIIDLRKKVYARLYPEVTDVENDPFDDTACVIYTQGRGGRVNSTARIAFDADEGIPEAALVADLVAKHRKNRVNFAELGRFVIDDAARGVLNHYYRAYYELGVQLGIDMYFMFVPENKISLYTRLMDAEVVKTFDDLTFGGSFKYVCMEWWLNRTRPRFFTWCGANPKAGAQAREGLK